jgi:hypothetical protein
MFELFGSDRRAPQRGKMPLLISTIMHLLVVAVVFIVPIVYMSSDLPPVPDMLAFVVPAATELPAPPPPPPPAPAAPKPPNVDVH